jgi:hypothetical protein
MTRQILLSWRERFSHCAIARRDPNHSVRLHLAVARPLMSHARSEHCRTIMPTDSYLASLTKRSKLKSKTAGLCKKPGRCELVYATV